MQRNKTEMNEMEPTSVLKLAVFSKQAWTPAVFIHLSGFSLNTSFMALTQFYSCLSFNPFDPDAPLFVSLPVLVVFYRCLLQLLSCISIVLLDLECPFACMLSEVLDV